MIAATTMSTRVAYYHTHPLYSAGGMRASYNEFSDDDVAELSKPLTQHLEKIGRRG
jgi:hypothetical protein